MRQIDILILCEHVSRELDIACALTLILRKRFGLTVAVAPLAHDLEHTIEQWKPRIVVVPYFYSARDFGIRRLVDRFSGSSFVNLAFEHLLSPATEKMKRPRDQVACREVRHLAGNKEYENLLHRSGVGTHLTTVVGSMACQLYRDPYKEYYITRRDMWAAQFGLDAELPWVLLPENFGAAFLTSAQRERRIRQGFDAGELDLYINYARASFSEVMRWVAEAAAQGGAEFIIRPRPAMQREAFLAEFRSTVPSIPSSRLHILKELSVREWILASDVVVSTYSTSLVEAAVANKPAYLIGSGEIPAALDSDWTAVAPRLSSREDFMLVAQNAFSSQPSTLLSKWAEENLLAWGDPIENAAQAIGDVSQGAVPAPRMKSPPPMQKCSNHISRLKTSLLRLTRPLRRSKGTKFGHQDDSFSEAQVKERVERWQKLLLEGSVGTTTIARMHNAE